jgi:hypothetical protein
VWLCSSCAEAFEYRLAEVDAVLTELAHAVPRLTLTATYGDRAPGVRALHAPAPVNVSAVSPADELTRLLMNACLHLAARTRVQRVGKGAEASASYLIKHMKHLVSLSWAPRLCDEIGALIKDCERVTQEHNPRVFAGTCAECETDLYAAKGDHEARCKTCGATYEVLKWQAYAQTAKDYYIGSPADLSRKLSAPQYGIEVTADQIRKWGSRGKLERTNPEQDETGIHLPPVYRLGDVLDLVQARHHKTPLEGRTA